MRVLKRITGAFNGAFINLLLMLFYAFGIGLGAFIKLFFRKKKAGNTYWARVDTQQNDLNSPY
jgi:hypothetical protein